MSISVRLFLLILPPFILASAVQATLTENRRSPARPSQVASTIWPTTKAEATNYKETSTYADVMSFIADLQKTGFPMHVKFSGKSPSGKDIPLLVISRPLVNNPAEAKRTGKPIIYIQANIHAGEVEGKEASLMLIRDYMKSHPRVLDQVILIVQPIYNIDGNDAFGPSSKNRPGQTGPDIVGLRANGQGFDLNRDCIKAESPEMQGVLKNIYTWNPDVVMDLHTTNGTRHGYPLTYAGPLHVNTHPAIQEYALNELLPTVRKEYNKKFNKDLFDYGNGEKDKEGKWYWTTFASEGRYVTNYAGLRNSIGILSEAMVYETFQSRVEATYQFVDLCVRKVIKDGRRIVENHRRADKEVASMATLPLPKELGLRYETTLRGKENVLLEKATPGVRKSGPITESETVLMPVFDRFKAIRSEQVPTGYFFSDVTGKFLPLLQLHGIRVEKILEKASIEGQTFEILQSVQSPSMFQGHRLIRLEGNWKSKTIEIASETFYVPMSQPLALLIFDLFEPTCQDGATAWGFLGETFAVGSDHNVRRHFGPLKVARAEILP